VPECVHRVVRAYRLIDAVNFSLPMPRTAPILGVEERCDGPVIVALVSPHDEVRTLRSFSIVEENDVFDSTWGAAYIGSYTCGGRMRYVFERRDAQKVGA
jgi:hypothetical protein